MGQWPQGRVLEFPKPFQRRPQYFASGFLGRLSSISNDERVEALCARLMLRTSERPKPNARRGDIDQQS